MNNKILPWVTTRHIHRILKTKTNMEYRNFVHNHDLYLENSKYCSFDDDGQIIIKNSVNDRIRNEKGFNIKLLTIEDIIELVCANLKIEKTEITSPSLRRDLVFARGVICYLAHYMGDHSLKNIAEIFDQQPDSVSRSMHRQCQKQQFHTTIKKVKPGLIAKQDYLIRDIKIRKKLID